MRVFTAVDVEDEHLLDKLVDLRNFLDFGFNPVPRQKMHLTLQFFQDLQDVEPVVKALQNVSTGSFGTEVKGAGVFPSRDRVRVVWAGLDSEKIFELQHQASQHEVEDSSTHDFHPHITLARVDRIARGEKKDFREKLEQKEDVKIGELEIDAVKVFESIQKGKGTEYNLLKSVKL